MVVKIMKSELDFFFGKNLNFCVSFSVNAWLCTFEQINVFKIFQARQLILTVKIVDCARQI